MDPKQHKQSLKALARAAAIIGSYNQIAVKLGISNAAVSGWATGKKHMSLDNAMKIQKLTNGLVTVHDLRPDISDVMNKV